MRLLPDDKDLGWLPYGYLLYLSFFLTYPLAAHASRMTSLWTGLAVIVFLPLYFLSYWVHGAKLLWIIAAMTVLGVVYGPFNPGASVFFIYAAAAGAFAGSVPMAWIIICVIVGVVAVESLVLHLPGPFWIPAVTCSIFVGAICIHAAQRKVANAK